MLEKLCKELGVEVGEEWTGNDGIKHQILPSGEIRWFEEGWGWKRLGMYEEVLTGRLKPVWKPKLGDRVWCSEPYEESKAWVVQWNDTLSDRLALNRGLIHKTREQAIEATNKMLDALKEYQDK